MWNDVLNSGAGLGPASKSLSHHPAGCRTPRTENDEEVCPIITDNLKKQIWRSSRARDDVHWACRSPRVHYPECAWRERLAQMASSRARLDQKGCSRARLDLKNRFWGQAVPETMPSGRVVPPACTIQSARKGSDSPRWHRLGHGWISRATNLKDPTLSDTGISYLCSAQNSSVWLASGSKSSSNSGEH